MLECRLGWGGPGGRREAKAGLLRGLSRKAQAQSAGLRLGQLDPALAHLCPPSLLTFKFEDVGHFAHGTELHIQELRLSRGRMPETSSNLWGPPDPNRPVLGSTGKGCQGWGACSKAPIQSVSVLPLAPGPLCLESSVTEEGRRRPTPAVASCVPAPSLEREGWQHSLI